MVITQQFTIGDDDEDMEVHPIQEELPKEEKDQMVDKHSKHRHHHHHRDDKYVLIPFSFNSVQ